MEIDHVDMILRQAYRTPLHSFTMAECEHALSVLEKRKDCNLEIGYLETTLRMMRLSDATSIKGNKLSECLIHGVSEALYIADVLDRAMGRVVLADFP